MRKQIIRDKKTGEVLEVKKISMRNGQVEVFIQGKGAPEYRYFDSLAELADEYEFITAERYTKPDYDNLKSAFDEVWKTANEAFASVTKGFNKFADEIFKAEKKDGKRG